MCFKKSYNGKKCTISWHIDNNKISHVDENVVSQVISDIEEKLGKMSVMSGNEQVCFGMNIKFNKNSTVTSIVK